MGGDLNVTLTFPYPNKEGLPQKVSLRVLMPEAFPWEPVEVFSLTDDVKWLPTPGCGIWKTVFAGR